MKHLELSDFTSIPVDIKTFVKDPQYLGNVVDGLYPYWKEKLQEVYPDGPLSPYSEVLLEGALGAGRTYAAIVGFLYDLYLLTMLRDPHGQWTLLPSTGICLVVLVDDPENRYTRDVILDFINLSPYFKSILLPGKGEELEDNMFPNRIGVVPMSANRSYLGRAIAGVLYEDTGDNMIYENYKCLSRRMTARFMGNDGVVPCRFWAVFDATRMASSRLKVPHVHRRISFNPSIWEVQAFKGIYCGETFSVFIGNDTEKPFILEEGKVYGDYLHGNVIHVPVEYREDFEKDIYAALRELAGIAVNVPAESVKVPALTIVTNDLKLNLIALYALGMIMAFLLGYYCGMN